MAGEKNGSSAAVGVISVIAIIGSVGGIMFSINRPMAQRIDQLERALEAQRIQNLDAHKTIVSEIRKDDERELRHRGIDSAQWERIYSLEREHFDTPLPQGGSR